MDFSWTHPQQSGIIMVWLSTLLLHCGRVPFHLLQYCGGKGLEYNVSMNMIKMILVLKCLEFLVTHHFSYKTIFCLFIELFLILVGKGFRIYQVRLVTYFYGSAPSVAIHPSSPVQIWLRTPVGKREKKLYISLLHTQGD